jgi:hypothetical protein
MTAVKRRTSRKGPKEKSMKRRPARSVRGYRARRSAEQSHIQRPVEGHQKLRMAKLAAAAFRTF